MPAPNHLNRQQEEVDSDLADLLGDGNHTSTPVSSNESTLAVVTSRTGQEVAGSDDDNHGQKEREALLGASSTTTAVTNGREVKKNSSWTSKSKPSASGFSYHPQRLESDGIISLCGRYVTAYVSLLCYYHPWLCTGLALGVGVLLLTSLVNVLFNPVKTYGVMLHDHSNIKSAYDLSMSQIDHWCLGGGNEDCLCEDPLTPSSQMSRRPWVKAFWRNREAVERIRADPLRRQELDVAFLGGSLVEEMNGRWLGRDVRPLAPVKSGFERRFQRELGGKFEGVALGIAGDTAPNVLYRLIHGEMSENFEPKVWWIVLGMNDLSRMLCSEEVTVIGVLRVVEEILNNRPNSRVVINSLLPIVYSRGGQYALIHDYQDSLGEMGNRLRDRTRYDLSKATDAVKDGNEGWRQRRLRADEAEEDDTAEETRLETNVRQKEGKRESGGDHNVLNAEAHRTRKYNLVLGLLPRHGARTLPPLWTAVYAVNKELKAFADKNENVDFFDATPVFAKKLPEAGKYELLSSRISARGHPTPDGFAAWEDAMLVRLDSIITAMKRDQPELFSVLDRYTDDHAGLPNVTDHPGFGFEDGTPPEVGVHQHSYDGDDGDTDDDEDEGSGKDSKKAASDGAEGGDEESNDNGDDGDDKDGDDQDGDDQDGDHSPESQSKDAEREETEDKDGSELKAGEAPPSNGETQSENEEAEARSGEHRDQEPDQSKNGEGNDSPHSEGGGTDGGDVTDGDVEETHESSSPEGEPAAGSGEQRDQAPDELNNPDGDGAPPREGGNYAGAGAEETHESSPSEGDPRQSEEERAAQTSDGEPEQKEGESPREPQQ